MLSMQLRKPRIKPPVMMAGINGAKISASTLTQAGQFQVIIGNTVSDFYNDFIAVSGIDGVSKDAVKSAAKQCPWRISVPRFWQRPPWRDR